MNDGGFVRDSASHRSQADATVTKYPGVDTRERERDTHTHTPERERESARARANFVFFKLNFSCEKINVWDFR